jgi:hypothetical protein
VLASFRRLIKVCESVKGSLELTLFQMPAFVAARRSSRADEKERSLFDSKGQNKSVRCTTTVKYIKPGLGRPALLQGGNACTLPLESTVVFLLEESHMKP